MAEYSWEDNSKQVYDTAVSMAPKPFRPLTVSSLDDALAKRLEDGGTVTEDIIVDCIKEITPKPFLSMGMKRIKPLLKNP